MNVNERREIYCHCLTAKTPMCVNCKHYYQHFGEGGWTLNMGHCVYPRIKMRRSYDTCGWFEAKK